MSDLHLFALKVTNSNFSLVVEFSIFDSRVQAKIFYLLSVKKQSNKWLCSLIPASKSKIQTVPHKNFVIHIFALHRNMCLTFLRRHYFQVTFQIDNRT